MTILRLREQMIRIYNLNYNNNVLKENMHIKSGSEAIWLGVTSPHSYTIPHACNRWDLLYIYRSFIML